MLQAVYSDFGGKKEIQLKLLSNCIPRPVAKTANLRDLALSMACSTKCDIENAKTNTITTANGGTL